MSKNTPTIAALLEQCRGSDLDAHYLAFFECFNRQLFFEAHEVLEELWLVQRGTPRDAFYKGLIQLAGAFVHVQKNRPQPALALLRLARGNLEPYVPLFDQLDVASLLERTSGWHLQIQNGRAASVLEPGKTPKINLEPNDEAAGCTADS